MKNLKLFFLAAIILATYTLTAQVSITTDGTDPDGSAMLEVKSTAKGFLPPRMTNAEIKAISNPTEGLMVYSNEENKPFYYDGSEWKGFDGTSTLPLAVGDSYGGGIIFYLDGTGEHGLIAATADQSSGLQWTTSTYQNVTVPGGATSLTDGLANSNAIVAQAGAGITYAAGLCRAYSATGDGGLNDWYLPSKDELNNLYLNKDAIGGFDSGYYWSSSEYFDYSAWRQYFPTGTQYNASKSHAYRFRAVRAF